MRELATTLEIYEIAQKFVKRIDQERRKVTPSISLNLHVVVINPEVLQSTFSQDYLVQLFR